MTRWAHAIAFTALVGCADVTEPSQTSAPVQTDASSYVLERVPGGFEAVAQVTYTNPGPATVHFARCSGVVDLPMYGIRREANPELPAFVGGVWACVGGVPTGRIEPGTTIELQVWLGSLDSPNANPPIRMEHRTGTFRVLLELCERPEHDSDECDLRPQAERQSNVFEILPPG